jgi:hypothetical protein
MCEPVSKEDWRQYFRAKLTSAEQRAMSAPTEREREHLRIEADRIRTKLWLLDFDIEAWRACDHANC